jgi:GT2 family glycosyltransferase
MQPGNESTAGGYRLKGISTKSTTEFPLVTVVTAVYNGQPHVSACLESVSSQDYPNIEHIIVDGGSTDGTLDVLRGREDRIALWGSGSDGGVLD